MSEPGPWHAAAAGAPQQQPDYAGRPLQYPQPDLPPDFQPDLLSDPLAVPLSDDSIAGQTRAPLPRFGQPDAGLTNAAPGPAPAATLGGASGAQPGTVLSTRSEYWAHPAPEHKKRRGMGLKVANIILLCVVALVTISTLAFFAVAIGVNVFLLCGALALIPLTICVLTLRWIDKWEPEPITAMILGFCWGAGMAVVAALVVGSWVQPLLMNDSSGADANTVSALVESPLVEELCKGAGVLLLFFARRRTFDGPVDGVVYAGIIAAGFAFTENILYFGQALEEAHGEINGLVGIFLLRGLMSPFAHVMFTATLGVCVGWAARHGGTWLVVGAWLVGMVPAMFLHGLWNGTAFLGANFFLVYVVLQVPLFVLFIVGIVLLRRSEAKLTRRRLSEYVPSGWFTQQEVPMLATGAGRRRALHWSKTFGAGATMKEFIRLATRLAFIRQRLLVDAKSGQGGAAAARFAQGQARELAQLNRITAVRSELLGHHSHAVWQAQNTHAQHLHLQAQNTHAQHLHLQAQNNWRQPPS